ncbi:PQ loop repeat-domain-containing protein, partial [Endogone sp. FLAS-F59071]
MDGVFLSNIVGYISICCWFVVYTPQLYENYKRKSGDGLSMTFLIIWLAGDVFNVLGVVYQDLLFTMLLLGLYYTIADIGLIYQVIYYRRYPIVVENVVDVTAATPIKETTPLLSSALSLISYSTTSPVPYATASPMRRRRLLHAFALALFTSLAGAVLFWGARRFPETSAPCNPDGIVVSLEVSPSPPSSDRDFQVVPQIFGWISALLYVGSRVPQIVKNHRNRSTEGLSLAMFGFSVLGNTTFCLVGLSPLLGWCSPSSSAPSNPTSCSSICPGCLAAVALSFLIL